MVRRATAADVDECLRLGLQFHAYSPWAMFPADPEGLRAFLASLIEGGAVFLSEGGMIGGVLTPLYFNPSLTIAAELFWWAPKDGDALRQAFEAWAVESGAVGINFTGLADARAPAITRVYRRAGYAPVETSYFKKVS